jgi:hypothetical protein
MDIPSAGARGSHIGDRSGMDLHYVTSTSAIVSRLPNPTWSSESQALTSKLQSRLYSCRPKTARRPARGKHTRDRIDAIGIDTVGTVTRDINKLAARIYCDETRGSARWKRNVPPATAVSAPVLESMVNTEILAEVSRETYANCPSGDIAIESGLVPTANGLIAAGVSAMPADPLNVFQKKPDPAKVRSQFHDIHSFGVTPKKKLSEKN